MLSTVMRQGVWAMAYLLCAPNMSMPATSGKTSLGLSR